jgi:iron(III) transport system substrate-binding protein
MICKVRIRVSALLLFCAALTATMSQSQARELTIYNAQHRSLTAEWVEGFTRDTGVKVTIRNGDDTELGNQLLQEGSATPADVFLTENSPAMSMVEQPGLLAPVDPPTLEQVAPAYRPSTGHWIVPSRARLAQQAVHDFLGLAPLPCLSRLLRSFRSAS